MQGYESGNLRYYTWFPPEGEEVETGMWGSTAAGTFQLKKAGEDRFVLWDGNQIASGSAYDASKSFPVTAGGAFEIRVYFEEAVLHTMPVRVSRLLRVVPLRFVFISKKMNALKLLL